MKMSLCILASVLVTINSTGCDHSGSSKPKPPDPPKPVQPAFVISPADAPMAVDEMMKFVLSDLIEPARAKIAENGDTPDRVRQRFPQFLQWLTAVGNIIRADASVQGSRASGLRGMQEIINFSGIHYQCDLQKECHDLLGAAAESESANLNNAAKGLVEAMHGQSIDTRNGAADYFLKNFSLL
jgi:hypothetical protein